MQTHLLKKVVKICAVDILHIAFRQSRAELTEVRPCSDILDLYFRSRIVRLEAGGVVADQIDPSGAAIALRPEKGPVVACRGKANFK